MELVSIRFVTFKEAGLPMDASDRLVWRYAQENQMLGHELFAGHNRHN